MLDWICVSLFFIILWNLVICMVYRIPCKNNNFSSFCQKRIFWKLSRYEFHQIIQARVNENKWYTEVCQDVLSICYFSQLNCNVPIKFKHMYTFYTLWVKKEIHGLILIYVPIGFTHIIYHLEGATSWWILWSPEHWVNLLLTHRTISYRWGDIFELGISSHPE